MFGSFANDLVPGDTNNQYDLFVRDRAMETTERVNLNSAEGQVADAGLMPEVSDGGRFVAFLSLASDLVPGDNNGQYDYFVRDRLAGTTERVSLGASGAEGNDDSYPGDIDGQGRFVSFTSHANNLVPGDQNNAPDVFVRDRLTNVTSRVSVNSSGVEGTSNSGGGALSSDGRFVAYESLATNLVPEDTNTDFVHIFVHDRVTGQTSRASVDSAGNEADARSCCVQMSGAGRFVAFTSFAANLVPDDTNTSCGWGAEQCPDTFVHDLLTGITTRATLTYDDQEENTASYGTAISTDGRYVAFDSDGKFAPGDDANWSDVFVRDLGDTDRDGEWNPFDSDDDNDSILDAADNCPLVENLTQSDNDADGRGDVCDGDDDNDRLLDVVTCAPEP